MTARSFIVSTGLAVIAAVAVMFYFYSKHELFGETSSESSASRIRLAVLSFAWDADEELTAAVQASLQDSVEIVTAGDVGAAPEKAAFDEIASRLEVDAVLSGERLHAGRFEGVNVFLYRDGINRHVWSAGRPHASFRHYRDKIAQQIATAVKSHLEISREAPVAAVPRPDALREYLEGRAQLDRSHAAARLRRIVAHFEAAFGESPGYAAAFAGLCDALVTRSLLEGDQRLLDDAEKACEKATALGPDEPEALIARGNLLRERGMYDDAILAFDKALKRDAYYPHAYLGLAEVHFASYLRSGSPDAADQAIQRAVQAAKVDPHIWKAPYLIGLIYVSKGNNEDAIEAMEEAKTLDANVHVLSRLGALYACQGEQGRADAMYARAREISSEFFMKEGASGQPCKPESDSE